MRRERAGQDIRRIHARTLEEVGAVTTRRKRTTQQGSIDHLTRSAPRRELTFQGIHRIHAGSAYRHLGRVMTRHLHPRVGGISS